MTNIVDTLLQLDPIDEPLYDGELEVVTAQDFLKYLVNRESPDNGYFLVPNHIKLDVDSVRGYPTLSSNSCNFKSCLTRGSFYVYIAGIDEEICEFVQNGGHRMSFSPETSLLTTDYIQKPFDEYVRRKYLEPRNGMKKEVKNTNISPFQFEQMLKNHI